MQSYTEKYKKIIVPIIVKHLPDAIIMIYGSRARGDDSQGSDIDIALDAGSKIERTVLNAIVADLDESSLPIFFDVVDFHNVSSRMQKEIIKDGVIWKK